MVSIVVKPGPRVHRRLCQWSNHNHVLDLFIRNPFVSDCCSCWACPRVMISSILILGFLSTLVQLPTPCQPLDTGQLRSRSRLYTFWCKTFTNYFAPEAAVALVNQFNFTRTTRPSSFKIRVHISATCIGPLGMESGVIGDNQIQASSSFEHASVGPHNAR